jgi:hypothetical protein
MMGCKSGTARSAFSALLEVPQKYRRTAQKGKKKGRPGEAGAALSHLISYQPQAGPTPIPTGPIPMPRLMPGA